VLGCGLTHEELGELSLACPDEGVWAYVGWVELRFVAGLWFGRLRGPGRALLACPDEGVWAYVG
jgi:hypothetical protein